MLMLELTDREDECLRLYWGKERPSQRAIARRLGISQPVVWRRIRNGRRKLQHGVGNREIPTDPMILDQLDPRQIRAVV